MSETKQVFWVLNVAMFVLWPISAAAAQLSFGDSIVAMSWLSIMITLLLSSLSGLTSLLRKVEADLIDHGEIKHLSLYVTSKIMASNMSGLLALFLSEGRLDHNYQAGVIIIASYGGVVILENSLNKALNWIDTKGGASS